MTTILSGQMDVSAATEAVAFASNTDVASFTDNNHADSASAFTATIDWGDGSTSTGTVVGSNGLFTVEGGHTFADEGFPQATVTITRTADNTVITPTGTIAVADADNITVQGTSLTGNPNQPLTNVTVATFTTANTNNIPGDFAVTIDWGDGTTTPGTVAGSNGSFTVTGTHTYTAVGEDIITVFANDDDPNGAFNSGTSQVLIGVAFDGHVVLNAATEGQALGAGTTVATFADSNHANTAGNFTASIDWGDGTTTAGTVAGSNGSFSVQGNHTYADEGDAQVTVTITRTTDSTVVTTPPGTVVVAEADFLTPIGKTIGAAQPSQVISGIVATFADNNSGNAVGDFTATIDWGDGTTSAGTVTVAGSTYSVSGSHAYTDAGQDTVVATLIDDDPSTNRTSATGTAFVGFNAGTLLLTDATENVALPGNTAIGTFTDGILSDTAGSFTAQIVWGDGTTTAGTVVGANGSFTVEGGHTYGDEFSALPVSATLTRTSDSAVVVDSGNVDVAENDVLTPTGKTITGNPNQAISNATVATFTDTNTANGPADFTASIDWGDGATTVGTVTQPGGLGTPFAVIGTHTYTTVGHDTVSVTLTDDLPGTASSTATSGAFIGLAGQAVPTSATEGVAINSAVATFTDSNLSDVANGFTASINWGDGTTTTGSVTGGNGAFTVSGNHAYNDEMSAPLVATLVRTSDSATAQGSGNVAVAEADVLTPQVVAISASQNQAFNGTVATFNDTDTLNVAGDFTATINWGDGTTTVGTVAGGSGAFSVAGVHTYAAAGPESVKVTLTDDAPGSATATANSTANVAGQPLSFIGIGDFDANTRSDIAWETNNGQANLWMNTNGTLKQSPVPLAAMGSGTWTAYGVGDFNGDGKSDILWTSNTGQVAVWEMNGPNLIGFGVPAGQMGAPAWHVAAIGDFNGDGKSDLLWANNAGGHAAVWTMNGTVMSDFSLSNGAMGPEWSVLGAGDFNQDGRADVAWENTSGTVDIWEMNGPNLSGFDANVGTAPGRFAGVGHFTPAAAMGDRTPDIVWVDNTNHVTIWEMSGGHIANTVSLNGLDGSAWHLEGVGNFAGDTNSDLLWINNTTGAVNIWEVNGSNVTEIPVSAPTGNPLTLKAGTQSSQSAPDSGAAGGLVDSGSDSTFTVVLSHPLSSSFVVVGSTFVTP